MLRRIAAVIAATALLLVLAIPAMAGGWAEIEADAQLTRRRQLGPHCRSDVIRHGAGR